MLDFGWSEMAVILLVALIVIGPKDLPKVARALGRWSAKARSLAREFQRSLDEMAREAELDEIKKEIEKVSRIDLKRTIEDTVDPKGEIARATDLRAALPKNPLAAAEPAEIPAPAPSEAAPPAVSSSTSTPASTPAPAPAAPAGVEKS